MQIYTNERHSIVHYRALQDHALFYFYIQLCEYKLWEYLQSGHTKAGHVMWLASLRHANPKTSRGLVPTEGFKYIT
jgi:hypothetical protein